ncbi:hypothetical protein [Streptomyces sp. S186]|uniref:hypothetical protein n=1 Tax=Streptomyces sp. S186 TaxID=3434395 RepID=UPI003F679324
MARRLDGEVCPAVLALMKALLVQAGGLGTVTKIVESFGGFAKQYEQIEKVSAHHGNFWEVLLYGQIGRDRALMFGLAERLQFTAPRRTGGCWTRTRSVTRPAAASTSAPSAKTASASASPSPRRAGRRPYSRHELWASQGRRR